MFNDFLFELGSEELPSGAVKLLSDALAKNLVDGFASRKLSHGDVKIFATPRRLAVLVEDLQAKQESQYLLRRGPSVAIARDAQALIGFAKSCGVTVDMLTTTKTDKGEWWAYEATSAGLDTVDLLPSLVAEAIANLPIPKPMRWGDGGVQFARPVHWAVLLFGDAVVPATLLGIQTGRDSFGHRYHHPKSVSITSPHDYESLLNKANVIADFVVRRQMIVDQITSLADQHASEAIMPDALLDEVTSIVEWPCALLVGFDSKFLEVPAEALIAAMQVHQKCFALQDSQQQLLPQFITVSNIASRSPEQVIKGNESVMRARLSDAAFFFNQDKKQSLAHYQPATETVIFQKQLGSLADKARRMQAFLEYIAPTLNLDPPQALRAAFLSKCDLMTGMVGEFPELQGLMGFYYARIDGEDELVARALNEQYMPRFALDALPASGLGQAMSLADRLDTLVGAFALGQKPTGVKDPFKLRRHALAVVRLLIAIPVAMNLSTLIQEARATYGNSLVEVGETLAELKPFILERMQSYYQGQGIAADLVRAVRARQDDCLLDFDQRLNALVAFTRLPEAQALSAACKRVNNILQHVSDDTVLNSSVESSLLLEPAEKALLEQIKTVEARITPLYLAGDYNTILTQLAGLRESVDLFFDKVMVMVEDAAIRSNRLCILKQLQSLLQGVADISLLQLSS